MNYSYFLVTIYGGINTITVAREQALVTVSGVVTHIQQNGNLEWFTIGTSIYPNIFLNWAKDNCQFSMHSISSSEIK